MYTARSFESLPENLQERIYLNLVEKYSLQGKESPSKLSWKKIKEQRPMSYRAWQRLNFYTLQGIDKALTTKGLLAKHFK